MSENVGIWSVLPVAAVVAAVVSVITIWLREALTQRREKALADLQIASRIQERRLERLTGLIAEFPVARQRVFRTASGELTNDMQLLVASIDEQCSYVEQKVFPLLSAESRQLLLPRIVELRGEVSSVLKDFRSGKDILSLSGAGRARALANETIAILLTEIDNLQGSLDPDIRK